jgi:molybdenum cofactor biosynthesis protein B
MPTPEHREKSVASVPCAVVTVSDTRTLDTDKSGAMISDSLIAAGHSVYSRDVEKDDPPALRSLLEKLRDNPDCSAVLITGGTGLSPRDGTYEVVVALLDKRLDGFGELFRTLSFDEIGPAAMLSRAVAGVMGRTVVFSMPGSPGAVKLAMERLILPVLGHAAALACAPLA